MARIYAKREDNGEIFLIEITCDSPECKAKYRPGIDSREGWTKRGITQYGDFIEWYYCPIHG